MSSFESGPIFPPPSGKDLSRNISVVSIYAFEKNSYGGMCPGMASIIFVRATFHRENHIVSHCKETHIEKQRKVVPATGEGREHPMWIEGMQGQEFEHNAGRLYESSRAVNEG